MKATWVKSMIALLLVIFALGTLLLVMTLRSPWVADGAIQSLTHHGSPQAILPPSADYELVSLQTKDGTHIFAQLGRAKDQTGTLRPDYHLLPAAIYFYPGGGTMRWSAPQFEGLRRLGLNVLMPEYPGYGMSDGHATESGFCAAADAAYDYALSREDVSHAGILAAGWSLGGSTAVDLAGRRPTIGLILLGTSTTFADIVHHLGVTHPFLSWLGGPLLARIGTMVKLDSLSKIPSVSCPILLVWGTRDNLVSREMTDRLIAATKAKVAFLPVEAAGHFDLFRAGGPRLWQAIGEWTSQMIPSATGAPAARK